MVTVAGRLHNVRESGPKLKFYDLHGDGTKIQIIATEQDAKGSKTYAEQNEILHRGDIVGVKGRPGRTKRGQLSIFAAEITLLSPCLHTLPKAYYGLKDQVIIICHIPKRIF